MLFGERCKEDHWRLVASRDQRGLQFDPTQPRHLHISDQARRVVQSVGSQKIFSRREGLGTIAERLQELVGCFTNERVVIDDRDHGRFGQDRQSSINRSYRERICRTTVHGEEFGTESDEGYYTKV